MNRCSSCHRHLREAESTCPFCGATLRSLPERLLQGAAASVTMVVLAACYGPPVTDKLDTFDSGVDADQDGFFSRDDCDDNNSAVNPGTAEDCTDGIDNDCDSLADSEDTDCVT